jgi:hypothetical protein
MASRKNNAVIAAATMVSLERRNEKNMSLSRTRANQRPGTGRSRGTLCSAGCGTTTSDMDYLAFTPGG